MITRLAIEALRLWTAARTRRPIEPAAVSSLALIELTGLGDVISMLPSIHSFRTLFPSADVHLFVDRSYVELLWSLQIPAVVHGVAESRSPTGVRSAIRLVKSLQPTLACSMSPPRRNALVALASGAAAVAGYLRHRDSLTPYLLQTPVDVYGLPCLSRLTFGRHHISERALMVCRALGGSENPARPVSISSSTAERMRADLLPAGVIPTGEYVVLHPFAGWKFREWPQLSFARLAERLLEAQNTTVVFLWEEAKEGNLPSLRWHFAGSRSVVFAPRLTLMESAVLISGASLFIGNDSGPLHLAAALGVPAVGLFGPSDPLLTAPRASGPFSALYERADCSPCDQRRCKRPSAPCMNMISVEAAFSAAASIRRRPVHA